MFRAVVSFVALSAIAGIAASDALAQATTGRLKAIAASKTIKIAYRIDAAPFSFVNERNEITGYTIELCKMIVASLQQQLGGRPIAIQWVQVTSQNRFDAIAAGKADLECGSSSATLARMKVVDFSSFVFVESTGLVVSANSGSQRLLDLAGKKLNATIVQVRDRDAGVAALQDGVADAFASDRLLLVGAQFKYPQALRLLPDDLSTEYYALVLPQGDWALRLAVNTALARIYRSGQIIKVFEQWFPQVGLRPGLLLDALYVLGAVPE
jgi:glutamate/aspartate transport system substrate-binding protein